MYICSSGPTSIGLSFFMCDIKRGYGDHLDFINFNRPRPFLYIGLRSMSVCWHCPFSCTPKKSNDGHLDFINFNKAFLFSVKGTSLIAPNLKKIHSLNLCYLGLYHRKYILSFSTLHLKEICIR